MYANYISLIRIVIVFITIIYVTTLILQYRMIKQSSKQRVNDYHRIQIVLIIVLHFVLFTVLLNYHSFSRTIILLYLGEVLLLLVTNAIIDKFFSETVLPLWSISQFLLVIGFAVLSRLNISQGFKQFYLAIIAYSITFIVCYLYSKIKIFNYLGLPAIVLAYILLLLTNTKINGATNWLSFGDFTFQPSEIVKILYILFLATLLTQFPKHEKGALLISGILTAGLMFIQVFRYDLGSALIFYVVFILMSYVYTTKRRYIIAGTLVTLLGGFFAYKLFSHVRVRVDVWVNPWLDIDQKGYQIAQSLFAIGNGGLFGSGLTLGKPNKIPVVTTDFIYSAIVEELGMIIAIAVIFMIVMFFLFGIQMIEKTKYDFDFLIGSGLLIIIAFQSFLIIGGVTKAVPLTGVTLPFVSYGGSSLVTTFIMLAILQGIKLNINNSKNKQVKSNKITTSA